MESLDQVPYLDLGQDARVEAELPCDGEPPLIACELLGTLGGHQVAILDPLKIGLEFPLKALPQLYGLDHEQHLGRVAALLANETHARLDCSPPTSPFSQTVTGTPRLAR